MRTILELFFFSNKKTPVCSQTDRDDCSRYHPVFRFLSSKIKLTPESNPHFECNVFHGFCYSFSQKQLRRENSIGKIERTFSQDPSLYAIFSPFVLGAILAFHPTVYCLMKEKSSLRLLLRLLSISTPTLTLSIHSPDWPLCADSQTQAFSPSFPLRLSPYLNLLLHSRHESDS